VAAAVRGSVQAVDNAMRKIPRETLPATFRGQLEEFDVSIAAPCAIIGDDEDKGAGALVRVLAIFSMAATVGALSAWLRISFRPGRLHHWTVSKWKLRR